MTISLRYTNVILDASALLAFLLMVILPHLDTIKHLKRSIALAVLVHVTLGFPPSVADRLKA